MNKWYLLVIVDTSAMKINCCTQFLQLMYKQHYYAQLNDDKK